MTELDASILYVNFKLREGRGMNTWERLLALGVPSTIANNLAAKKYTLSSLKEMKDTDLMLLGLSSANIKSIRNNKRPPIPSSVIHKVLEDSWYTCCICHLPERPFIIHHIVEWAKGGKHVEDNLAVLCLEHHDRAHTTSSMSTNLTKDKIKSSKTNWVRLAARLQKEIFAELAKRDYRSVRWYWVHIDNLRSQTATFSKKSVNFSDEFIKQLRRRHFINKSGDIKSYSRWKKGEGKGSRSSKEQRFYIFDFKHGLDLATYVSDLLGQWIKTQSFLDITDLLGNPLSLKRYLSVGDWIYVRDKFRMHSIENAKAKKDMVHAICEKTDVRIEFHFNAWMSLNQTSNGIHLRREAERSVVGQISDVQVVGSQLQILLSPLGISPDFVLHDPLQGDWARGRNNDGYKRRRKRAEDE